MALTGGKCQVQTKSQQIPDSRLQQSFLHHHQHDSQQNPASDFMPNFHHITESHLPNLNTICGNFPHDRQNPQKDTQANSTQTFPKVSKSQSQNAEEDSWQNCVQNRQSNSQSNLQQSDRVVISAVTTFSDVSNGLPNVEPCSRNELESPAGSFHFSPTSGRRIYGAVNDEQQRNRILIARLLAELSYERNKNMKQHQLDSEPQLLKETNVDYI